MENRGKLFKNTNKSKPSQPDFSGPIDVEGAEWTIAGWIATDDDGAKRTDKNGNTFINISIGPKTVADGSPKSDKSPAPSDDDLPF